MFAALLQTAFPGDCLLTGLCGIQAARSDLASGVMFFAVGLVALGALGLRARRNRVSR